MKTRSGARRALVTGSAQGIGLGIAQRLARDGIAVILTDLQADVGEQAAQAIRAEGGAAQFIQADVGDPASIQALVEEATAGGRPLDILVNNAGIVSTGDLATVDLAHWQRLLAIDVTAVFLLVHALLPAMMAQRWGRIVNIASVAGQQGGGLLGNSCYAAAKGAVIAFSKGIAREGGPAQVTSNVICPALTDTKMTGSMAEAQRRKIIEAIPLGRAGTPADVANAVAFLVAEEAGFINGVTLDVDGGFLRH